MCLHIRIGHKLRNDMGAGREEASFWKATHIQSWDSTSHSKKSHVTLNTSTKSFTSNVHTYVTSFIKFSQFLDSLRQWSWSARACRQWRGHRSHLVRVGRHLHEVRRSPSICRSKIIGAKAVGNLRRLRYGVGGGTQDIGGNKTGDVISFKQYRMNLTIQICTVNVRNPDVRISAFSKIVRFPNSPAFRRYLKSGQLCPVIGRSVPSIFTTGRPVFGTHSIGSVRFSAPLA